MCGAVARVSQELTAQDIDGKYQHVMYEATSLACSRYSVENEM